MSIEQFAAALFVSLEEELEGNEGRSAEAARANYFTVLKAVTALRDFFLQYKFTGTNEEVHFFKNTKSKFLSALIYYRRLFVITAHVPFGLPSDVRGYYETELSNVQKYLMQHQAFFTYCKSGSTLLDQLYFSRQIPDLWLALNTGEMETREFATPYDHVLATLLASERVAVFLVEEIKMQTQNASEVPAAAISWTASKAGLIELVYALQTSGVCNNGTLEVKELARHIEQCFNVKLGNFYRTFQEIRIRKISRTTFLDQLREKLVQRMDNSDENPRY